MAWEVFTHRWGSGLPRPYRQGRILKTPRPCSVDGCDFPAVCKGRCWTHDARWRRGDDLNAPVRHRRYKGSAVTRPATRLPIREAGES